MSAYEYDAVPFNGYWWIVRTYPKGKFSRLRQYATKKEACADLEATRAMIQGQIMDAKARAAAHAGWASESQYWRPKGEKPQEDAQWLNNGNLGRKNSCQR